MKKTLFLLATLMIASTACALTPPVITNTASKRSVVLGADVEKALKAVDSKFQIYALSDFPPAVLEIFDNSPNELPMAVMGDFNGDNVTDIVVLGRSQNRRKAYLLIAAGSSYTIIHVDQAAAPDVSPDRSFVVGDLDRQRGLSFYLTFFGQEHLDFAEGFKKRDAFQLENFRGGTKAYYLNNEGRIVEYTGLMH